MLGLTHQGPVEGPRGGWLSRGANGLPHLRYEFVDDMAELSPPLEMNLEPVTATVFAASGAGPSFSEDYMPVVFSTLTTGTQVCYVGMRATPRSPDRETGTTPPTTRGAGLASARRHETRCRRCTTSMTTATRSVASDTL
ncbi:hypothetical protein NKG94_04355 [Micromonospora sp. M12]